jgi:uncharacterized membrane protein
MFCPVPARQFTIVAAASLAFLFLDVDTACGFFKQISMTPACDMAPQVAIVYRLPLVQCLLLAWLFQRDRDFAIYAD